MNSSFLERTVVVGAFQCNCRILVDRQSGEALVIDPGDEPKKILNTLAHLSQDLGKPIQVKALFHTHGHLDHIGATRDVFGDLSQTQTTKPGIWLHNGDDPIYKALREQGRRFGFEYQDPLPITHAIQDQETFTVGGAHFSVLHTPGHSPGSVCLRLHQDTALGTHESLYSGDTLFRESVGRTDLWGADGDLMFKNIRTRLLTLDGDTRVCPGHGPDSTIAHESRQNPFLK